MANLICCSECEVPTTVSHCFLNSAHGELRRWLCADCGGTEHIPPEVVQAAKAMNAFNKRSIRLNERQHKEARDCAQARNEESLKRERINVKASSASDFFVNLIGAMGERAAFIYFGMPWVCRVNTFRQADLPGNIEVRSRTRMFDRLKVRYDDDNSRRCVLALVSPYSLPVVLAGWITAEDGKRVGTREDPRDLGRPFCGVKQEDLRPMEELKELVGSPPGDWRNEIQEWRKKIGLPSVEL